MSGGAALGAMRRDGGGTPANAPAGPPGATRQTTASRALTTRIAPPATGSGDGCAVPGGRGKRWVESLSLRPGRQTFAKGEFWVAGSLGLRACKNIFILLVLILVCFIVIEGRTSFTTMIVQPFHSCPNESTTMLVPTRGVNPNTARATSNRSENQSFPVLVPNLCFVHVGKTGGASISGALKTFLVNGHIGGAVQIHSSTAAAGVSINSGRDYFWDAKAGKYRPGKRQNQTEIDQSFEGEKSGSVRYFRTYHMNDKAMAECAKMGHAFTWIRDPVSRFVSVWNFMTTVRHKEALSNYTADDLETLIGNLTNVGLPKAWEFLRGISHVSSSISFYFGEKHQNVDATEIAWGDRSKSCKAILSSLPLVFVGRSEHMLSDWNALIKLLPLGANQVVLPHAHLTPRVGKKLSRGSVDFIRSLYVADYKCISEMVEIGLVDESYLQYILSDEREYTF